MTQYMNSRGGEEQQKVVRDTNSEIVAEAEVN